MRCGLIVERPPAYGTEGEDRSEIADIVDQLVSLADEEDAMLLEDSENSDEPEGAFTRNSSRWAGTSRMPGTSSGV